VNLGARLEGTNKVYGTPILVGEQTHRLAAEAIVMRPLDLVRVKGKRQPVEVFEPLAARAEASEDERALAAAATEALAHYRAQRWEAAREALAAIRRLRPEDGPARVLAERIGRFEAAPPGPGWDGVFEMTTK
jgi:adenylate cyclase